MDKIDFINAQAPALNDENLNKMQDNIERAINAQVSGDTLPIGTVLPYTNETAPENWLVCDGSELDRTEYNHLFAIIGTTFGEGDGSTTFNLPNIKGRTIVGLDADDTDFNTIGKTLGEKTHTLTVAEMPANNILTTYQGATVDGYLARGGYNSSTEYNIGGQGQEHNNIQPSIVIMYIIKAKQSAGIVATVVDSLASTSAIDALSAKQGKNLNEKITTNITTGQEFATNTYIDGKRIYAKRLKGTWGTETNMNLPVGLSGTDYTPLKIEVFVNTGNMLLFSGNTPRNGADTEIFSWWNITGDSIFCSSAGYNRQGAIVTATVYYIKN